MTDQPVARILPVNPPPLPAPPARRWPMPPWVRECSPTMPTGRQLLEWLAGPELTADQAVAYVDELIARLDKAGARARFCHIANHDGLAEELAATRAALNAAGLDAVALIDERDATMSELEQTRTSVAELERLLVGAVEIADAAAARVAELERLLTVERDTRDRAVAAAVAGLEP